MLNPYFEDLYINFENNCLIEQPGFSVPIKNAFFGILKLVAPSCDITKDTQELIFVIDRSGSMSDLCSDNRSKMQHIIHTLKNMVLYLKDCNNDVKFYVTIFVFDNKFSYSLKRTTINNDNIENIIQTIEKIRPLGSTNIELALTEVKEYINELKDMYPHHIISHIFMTDGEATDGNTEHKFLKNLVDDDINNAFIGFGINHDAMLLNNISAKKYSSYYFIDILEKAGLVYGEVLHGILYRYLCDVKFEIENGLIYDFKSNVWTNKLDIGNIVGETNKTYHIISNNPDMCNVIISFNNSSEILFVNVPKLIDNKADYTKYLYRQKTLELLFEVSQNQNNILNVQSNIFSQLVNDEASSEVIMLSEREKKEKDLKSKLIDLIKDIKKYMETNELNEDKFLKNLCDDIYISYKTIGTRYGAMYSCARQTSQGNQRCYTVTQTPINIDEEQGHHVVSIPKLNYKNVNNYANVNEKANILKLENPSLIHNVSNFIDAPYLTPTATRLMRDVSSGGNIFLKNPNETESGVNVNYTYSSDDDDDNLFTYLTKKKKD